MSNTLKLGNGKWATGKDTVLSFSDTNNNYKPLPFSFSRDTSATVVNKDGLIETVGSGEPRIDFKDNTKGALLLEPSRSNLLTYSEAFDNAAWGKVNSTITPNTSVSPDGTLNASTLVAALNGYLLQQIAYSGVSGQSATASIFTKNEITNFLRFGGATIAGTDVYSIEDYGNGWFRHIVTRTFTTTLVGSIQFIIYNPIGTNIIYGAQAEAGSYATSYIPTSGSAVTRVAESTSQTLPSAVPTSGVIYAEIELFNSVLDTSSTAIRYGINQTIYSGNWIFFGIEDGNDLRVYIRANDSTSFDYYSNNVFATAGVYKIAMRFAPNDTKVFVNGVQRASSENTVIASNLNNLNISGGGAAPSPVNNSVKNRDFRLYNTALTDQELIALTS